MLGRSDKVPAPSFHTTPPPLSSHGLLPSPDAQSCPWSFSPAAAWVKRVLTRARPTPGGESCVCCFFLKPPKWPIQMSGLSPARKPAPSTLFREHASFPALPTDHLPPAEESPPAPPLCACSNEATSRAGTASSAPHSPTFAISRFPPGASPSACFPLRSFSSVPLFPSLPGVLKEAPRIPLLHPSPLSCPSSPGRLPHLTRLRNDLRAQQGRPFLALHPLDLQAAFGPN